MYYSESSDHNPKLKDFFGYLEHRNSDERELMAMAPGKRKEIFMKWKWGGSVHEQNMEAESTRRLVVSRMSKKDVEDMTDEREKSYWQSVLSFEDYCYKTLQRIRIIKSNVIDDKVNMIVDKFQGTTVGGYERKDWE